MRTYKFCDVETKKFGGLETLFPGWDGKNERLCVYSPHDDDAIIGAGYVMRAALDDGAEVHIFFTCNGNCGYSTPEQKDSIVAIRRQETLNCYKAFGIPEENIVFMNFSDFSALSYIGWNVGPNHEGHFRTTMTELRSRRITRILAPNHYHEHLDHLATYMMAAYDAPQAGDIHTVDWAAPHAVQSIAQYAVWAEMDPEDALISGRNVGLRANTIAIASPEVEEWVGNGIRQYVSQEEIIADLIEQRRARMLRDGNYIEVYQRFDPRPRLNFQPYKDLLENN